MSNELLRSNNYILFTFASTSHALKAEQLLRSHQASFLVIPTLREISSSCGLSIKIAPIDLLDYHNYLNSKEVIIAGTYQVTIEDQKKRVEKILLPQDK